MKYGDFFHDTFQVFSKYPVIHLNEYDGKTVGNSSTICLYRSLLINRINLNAELLVWTLLWLIRKSNIILLPQLCVRDAVFPLLPRMRYGHFYNMPLVGCHVLLGCIVCCTVVFLRYVFSRMGVFVQIPGCEQSSMYRAFSQHILHRMNVTQTGPLVCDHTNAMHSFGNPQYVIV